ncbi:MAG: ABC transporter ATP-binding protein [Burkholderiaceae bacterium]|jgi:simple sugar transport system ATP-binding protein|nr:ABC transporter ATP-binding protein [Burkholderiaceae bacterium]
MTIVTTEPQADSSQKLAPALPRLELTGITKRYAGVAACDGVALAVRAGEIHAVLGENGAGKSTLMQIVYGMVRPDAGQVRLDGRAVAIGSPRQARRLGIGMVFQHFNLFPSLTVAENVWLGLDQSLARAQVAHRIRAAADAYGLPIDPARAVHTLAAGEMQQVEIIRALLAQPRLLILDEPTAALAPPATEKLFETLRRLAAQGCSILYISHKLDEIQVLCTACTVLRAGRVAGVCDPRAESAASLARWMLPDSPFPRRRESRGVHCSSPIEEAPLDSLSFPRRRELRGNNEGKVAPVLEVRGLNLKRLSPFGVDLADVSLTVHAGEIVGIAGVAGNGQRELLDALSGEDVRAPDASILIASQPAGRLAPARRRALGLHFAPEERLGRGTVAAMSLAHNLLLTRREAVGRGGWLHAKRLRAQTGAIIARFNVKAAGPRAPAHSLSGGNLQKFIMGREIDARPRLLMAAQPTQGVDAGAAARIHAALLALREAGSAALVVSDELDELLALCDRLYVMAQGRLSPPIQREHAAPEQIGQWMSGLWPST